MVKRINIFNSVNKSSKLFKGRKKNLIFSHFFIFYFFSLRLVRKKINKKLSFKFLRKFNKLLIQFFIRFYFSMFFISKNYNFIFNSFNCKWVNKIFKNRNIYRKIGAEFFYAYHWISLSKLINSIRADGLKNRSENFVKKSFFFLKKNRKVDPYLWHMLFCKYFNLPLYFHTVKKRRGPMGPLIHRRSSSFLHETYRLNRLFLRHVKKQNHRDWVQTFYFELNHMFDLDFNTSFKREINELKTNLIWYVY